MEIHFFFEFHTIFDQSRYGLAVQIFIKVLQIIIYPALNADQSLNFDSLRFKLVDFRQKLSLKIEISLIFDVYFPRQTKLQVDPYFVV